jgi:hypothetical protein
MIGSLTATAAGGGENVPSSPPVCCGVRNRCETSCSGFKQKSAAKKTGGKSRNKN